MTTESGIVSYPANCRKCLHKLKKSEVCGGVCTKCRNANRAPVGQMPLTEGFESVADRDSDEGIARMLAGCRSCVGREEQSVPGRAA
jgi:hypothetical protein